MHERDKKKTKEDADSQKIGTKRRQSGDSDATVTSKFQKKSHFSTIGESPYSISTLDTENDLTSPVTVAKATPTELQDEEHQSTITPDTSKEMEVETNKIFDLLLLYELTLIEMGFEQLIHKPLSSYDPILNLKGVAPTNEKGEEVNGIATFENALSHDVAARMSARLYVRNNSFYILVLKNIMKETQAELNPDKISKNLGNPQNLKPFPNGVCVVVIALIKNQDGILEQQLRIVPGATRGHPGLVFKNEGTQPPCIIAAGEAYILNNKIILINDKSGRFHMLLKAKCVDQKAVFDSMLKEYYADDFKENCFVHASEDDEEMIYEILRRGFPHSLLAPQSLRDSFPIESLHPPEFQRQVKMIDEEFKHKMTESLALQSIANTNFKSNFTDKSTFFSSVSAEDNKADEKYDDTKQQTPRDQM